MSRSSGEEDGDADWKAAIDSITAPYTNGISKPYNPSAEDDDHPSTNSKSRPFKLYQLKAQKIFDDLIEKNLEIVKSTNTVLDESPQNCESGIRLFRQAPPGIIFDSTDELKRPRKRPRIHPIEEIDEKSKKFKRRLKSVAVDGFDIMAAAKDACQKSLTRFEAKDISAKEKAKKEEERVEELKRVRGEKWLPSVARQMRGSLVRRNKAVGVVL